MAKNDLNIGVIGTGGRGALAAHAHDPDNGVRLMAGADTNHAAREAFRDKYGRDTLITDDYRVLLASDEVDAVFVTSPDFLHEEQAIAALNAGKHVYLEKPMAISVAGCDRILEAAHRNGVKLYLGHNMRHMRVIQKMKSLIDEGAIGEVRAGWCRHFVAYGCDAYFKDWHADRRYANSLLLQKGAHDIDVLHLLCGGYSTRVNAMGTLSVYNTITDRHPESERGDASWHMENWPPLSQKGLNPVIDVEDLSMMQMQLDNNVLCSYQQCHYSPDAWRNYTIIGTAGRIENFGDHPNGSPGSCTVHLWNERTAYKAKGHKVFEIDIEAGSHGGADPKIVQEFVRYVRVGGTIATSAIAARMSVAAGCMAAESLRNGGVPRDIPPLDPALIAYFDRDLAR